MRRRRCKQCGKLFMPVGKEVICSVKCRQERMKERAERRKAAYKKPELKVGSIAWVNAKAREAEKILKLAEKLKDYEDAEENGLLLRLPCKVGDIVWEVNAERKRISKFVIESITIYPCNVIQFNWTLLEGIYKNIVGFSKAELGKTVFLTKEEAEAKLKEEDAQLKKLK